jgi:uncharacterized YigZ family protein
LEDSFKTIKASAQAEIKIQRSKFIATAFPCATREEAETQIEKIAARYHDATHNCFGYRILSEAGREIFRYSDAGEPSGTAGRPIHDTLGSFKLINLGIVVTRYFGGVKLGTGGLARAYRDAARVVLEKTSVVERLIVEKFKITFPLNLTGIALRILSTDGVSILESNYTSEGEIVFEVRLSLTDRIKTALTAGSNARIGIEKIQPLMPE